MMELRVLGTLAVQPRPGGGPVMGITQPKRLALLLYLALAEPAGPHSRESLMALLWPEADDESTRHSLRNTIYGLRQALGEGAIVSLGEGYVGLDPAAVRCDAVEVRSLLAAQKWKEALAAWGGDLAPGFHVSGAPEFERWLDEQRAALRRAVAEAAWRRVDEMEQSGEPGVGEAARRAWAIDPTNEAGARRLMRLLDATAGRAAALRAYDDLVDYLRREYDAAPSAETRALAERLSMPVPAPPSTAPSPAVAAVSSTPAVAPASMSEPPPLAPSLRRRPGFNRAVLIGMALLVTLGASVVALRYPRSARAGAPLTTPGVGVRIEPLPLPARYRADTAAYGSYLRGVSLRFHGYHTEALDTFAALVARAPQYAPGYSGLALSYGLAIVAGQTPPSEGVPKAEAAARRAIALDSSSAAAWVVLGGVEMSWRWNLPLARKLIDRGLTLDPGDAESHIALAVWFRMEGELDSALAEVRMAHAMDPLNASYGERVAKNLYWLRRYAEADTMYRQILRDYHLKAAYGGLAGVYRAQGRTREALDMMRAAREAAGDTAGAARIPVATSDTQGARMLADLARERLHDLAEGTRRGDLVMPSDWADTYAALHDPDGTLRWIDSMEVGRDPGISRVLVDPAYDFIRSDPRYQAWEAKLPWRHKESP
jgi:DNA-binding SARP family transcriptional activator